MLISEPVQLQDPKEVPVLPIPEDRRGLKVGVAGGEEPLLIRIVARIRRKTMRCLRS